MKTHKDKIVVIGAGNVGEAIAYTLMVRVQASDIVLIDLNEKRAEGAALDIVHGTSFHRQVNVRKAGYEECADADLIIITAGIARKPGQTRLELAKTNISIVKSITKSIMEYAVNPLIVVVSNPADICTAAVLEESGLPSERVIGSGTSLDTARFRHNLSDELQVNVEDIHAYILGEHGDSQVAVYSSATVGSIPLEDYAQQVGVTLDKQAIAERTKNGGAEVIGLKGATFYGVAMSVSRIAEAVLNDENAVLPVCHVLGADSEWSGVPMSLPCRVGLNGISKTLHVALNEQEKAAIDHSAEVLKDFLAQVHEKEA